MLPISLSLLLIACGTFTFRQASCDKEYVRAVYLQSGSTARTDFEKYDISLIPEQYVTHVIYAFSTLDRTTYDNIVLDDGGQFKQLLEFQQYGVKCMLGHGGWGDSTIDYPNMLNVEENRNAFAQNIANFVAYNGFDGLDMDLEYPCCWQAGCVEGCEDDKVNFSILMELIRKYLDELGEANGKTYELTAAVTGNFLQAPKMYEIDRITKVVNYLHVMTYEVHNAYDGIVGSGAPFIAEGNSEALQTFNVVEMMNGWKDLGVPPEKMTVGLPFFSKSYKLKDESLHCTGDPSDGSGTIGGPSFFKTVKVISEDGNYEVVTPPYSTYATQDLLWMAYDDVQNVVDKARFARKNNYAGIMVWSVDQDHFRDGPCGKYPLLAAIHEALNGSEETFSSCTAQFSVTDIPTCTK